ncbi:hypothetical protein Metal_0817 [Methylomicrobium album BG8]|uniref:Uncharacterized protein n=1 Tax=Methylomicrobium album BG8 TaxID=686340 RepID=H8GQY8_METAL|nr:hypothetical protein Metal_0817 [Methylomicrobium album BG8]
MRGKNNRSAFGNRIGKADLAERIVFLPVKRRAKLKAAKAPGTVQQTFPKGCLLSAVLHNQILQRVGIQLLLVDFQVSHRFFGMQGHVFDAVDCQYLLFEFVEFL